MAAITRRYWWPKIVEDVKKGCQQCLLCARLRPGRKQAFAGGTLMAPTPGHLVALDHVGPLTLTGTGGKPVKFWVLTIIDHCTKFAVASLVTGTSAQETWYAFSSRWMTMFGVPQRIIDDGATSFKGEFALSAKEAGIHQLVTGPYYPQGNGVVEAFHKFLRHSIGALMVGTKTGLDKALNYSLVAYNQTPHPATGETPAFLTYGADMKLPKIGDDMPAADSHDRKQQLLALQVARNELMWANLMKLEDKEEEWDQIKSLHPDDLVLFKLSDGW
eukprot:GHVQ01030374.1.p1 GENE.GHVQ01030374.1~~GHVQ01030374.1.p1  ORF type:complete len:297 (-),score=25.36 GHVQ01030374.1:383-1204(-)